MGTWGVGAFDNDSAMDWFNDLQDAEDLSFLLETFEEAMDAEYLEVIESQSALAAAELIATLHDDAGWDMPQEVEAWIRQRQGVKVARYLPFALKAVKRIRRSSELRELWEESEDFDAWQKMLNRLELRLQD